MDRKIVVVDIGCRWGFAESFTSDIDNFSIYGFDPDQEECNKLNLHYSSKDIKAIPLALGREECTKTLFLTKEPACSSLYKPDPYLTSNYSAFHCEVEIGQTLISIVRLDDWARKSGIGAIDFLKIDTQGSELDILIGAGALLGAVRAIEVEVEFNPMYLGQPIFADVDLFLRSKGFVLWKFSEITHYSQNKSAHTPINTVDIRFDDWISQTVDEYAGQLFWANAHYVRTEVLSGKKTPQAQLRDDILFSTIGMPDVLGPQEHWSHFVNLKIAKNKLNKSGRIDLVSAEKIRAEQAEAKAEQAEARSEQAEAKAEQAEARTEQAEARAEQAEARTEQAEAILGLAQEQLRAIHSSRSWRFTAPFRRIMKFLRH